MATTTAGGFSAATTGEHHHHHATQPPVTPVAQLAAPRGVILLDEMTGKSATLQMIVEGVTYYYSTRESCDLDWSVLRHIGKHLAHLTAESQGQGTSTERVIHKERARVLTADVARITFDLASQRIIAQDYEHANPAALRCLRCLRSLHGESSPSLVPAYLLLAESNLCLGRQSQAEEFLSLSAYVLSGGSSIKSPATSSSSSHHHPPTEEDESHKNSLQSRLYRNFGKLYLAQGNPVASAEAFAKDILYSSLAHRQTNGPENIAAAAGYNNIGKAFAAQASLLAASTGTSLSRGGRGSASSVSASPDAAHYLALVAAKEDASFAAYDKVVQIWYGFLTAQKSKVGQMISDLTTATNAEREAASGSSARPVSQVNHRHHHNNKELPHIHHYKHPHEYAYAAASTLGPVEVAEGLDMLESIRKIREAKFGELHISVGEAIYTACLLASPPPPPVLDEDEEAAAAEVIAAKEAKKKRKAMKKAAEAAAAALAAAVAAGGGGGSDAVALVPSAIEKVIAQGEEAKVIDAFVEAAESIEDQSIVAEQEEKAAAEAERETAPTPDESLGDEDADSVADPHEKLIAMVETVLTIFKKEKGEDDEMTKGAIALHARLV